MKALAVTVAEEMKLKALQVGKEEIKKPTFFVDDRIIYEENPKDSTKKLLELMVKLRRLQDICSIHKSQLYFYIPEMNWRVK